MHGKQKNFRVWKDSRFDEVPYDYSSVMHYGSYVGSFSSFIVFFGG